MDYIFEFINSAIPNSIMIFDSYNGTSSLEFKIFGGIEILSIWIK